MEPKNYHPLSLPPIISKVLIGAHLISYLEHNDLLSKTQHGFRPKLSTEIALLTLCNSLSETIDRKNISLVTLCDLSKAFDSVNHKMLKKFRMLRIDSFWFHSYLLNITQSVRICKHFSKKLDVAYGVL